MFRKITTVVGCGVLAAAAMLIGAGSASAANPIGSLDSVGYDLKYNSIDVQGWAGDADAGSASIQVHIYLDGFGAEAVATGFTRTDVAAVHPGLGLHTGFFAQFAQPPGRGVHTVCAYAMNVASGRNTSIGCRSVTVTDPAALLGHIDRIAVDPADASRRIVSGWVLDPYDAVSPTPFSLVRAAGPTTSGSWDYLDGFEAGTARPDVDAVYPRNGSHHGFTVTFDTVDVDWAATDRVCLALDPWVPGWEGVATPYCSTYAG